MIKVDQSLLEKKYNDGKRYVVMLDGKPISWMKKVPPAGEFNHRFKGKSYDVSDLEVIPIRDLIVKVPTSMDDERFASEVQRIVKIVRPITEDEMLEVEKIAINNLMRQDLEDLVCRAVMER